MSKAQWIKDNLKDGERYAGIVLGNDGKPDHHLVLLPAKTGRLTWPKAKAWAAKVGGELPTRSEQAILYGNLKSEFEGAWYWSGEQYAAYSGYAWVQHFAGGYQFNSRKSNEYRARAVRRLLIIE
jgi:hypothetical protein